jgi:uncharacterized protein YPO0396
VDNRNRKRTPSLWRQASSVTGQEVTVTNDEIATRAFVKSLARSSGRAVDDWLEAERELLRERLCALNDHLRQSIEN